jgi:SAM-dependent methyltransferase
MRSAGQQQGRSFGAAAAAYERGRPPYPRQALDWVLPAGAVRVADLGAGTGKLTRQLAGRGLAVVAVEPLAGMREQLRRAVPGAPALAGVAEQLPLAGGCMDAVLAGQAWHWMDPARAVPEAARVLRAGGRLGLLWNIRDERADWVAELSRIIRSTETDDPVSLAPAVGPPFGPAERLDVDWEYRLPAGALTDYVASRSYIIILPEHERAAVLAQVRALLRSHPALRGREEIGLPQVTRCARAELPGRPGTVPRPPPPRRGHAPPAR